MCYNIIYLDDWGFVASSKMWPRLESPSLPHPHPSPTWGRGSKCKGEIWRGPHGCAPKQTAPRGHFLLESHSSWNATASTTPVAVPTLAPSECFYISCKYWPFKCRKAKTKLLAKCRQLECYWGRFLSQYLNFHFKRKILTFWKRVFRLSGFKICACLWTCYYGSVVLKPQRWPALRILLSHQQRTGVSGLKS